MTIPNLLGLSLLAFVLAASAGSWIFRLDYLGDQADSLQKIVSEKRINVVRGRAIADGTASDQTLSGDVAVWTSMADNESLRVASLSELATESGVIIVSLRSLGQLPASLADSSEDESDDEAVEEEATVVAFGHEIDVTGSQRQLANFLQGIYSAPGRVAIDDLLIQPLETDLTHQLKASLLVRWYTPMPDSDDEVEDDNG
ncbi:MAG: hypothetical protein HQ519_09615 [Planctomycetes bacterium]|nr:hypothetical protein [Planctomycetota bacterium]